MPERTKRLLRSVARILLGTCAVAACVLAALFWYLRQPNLGRLAYPGDNHAEATRLEQHVRFLALTDPSRDWRHPDGLARAAAYVRTALDAAGGTCREQPYRAGNTPMRNVIAEFGPADGPRIVVGAHYDVCGPLPGADDNASGVAGLLELARLLGGAHLDRRVELVAYSTEEPPFFGSSQMGSAVHAAMLGGTPLRAMISLEMIGFYSDRPPHGPALLRAVYPGPSDYIALLGRWSDRDLVRLGKRCFRGATRVPAVSYSGPVSLGSDLSDQRNYWARGLPAIMVSDTAFVRNPNYHEATDTPETLDYARMAGVVDGVFSLVVHLANDR